MEQINNIIGFHGTYLENLENIQKIGLLESKNHKEWLGDGVYFFVESVWDEPIKSARNYALDERFKEKGEDSNDEICVIEGTILVDNDKYLDLDTREGLEYFNMFREEIWEKFKKSGKNPTKEIEDHSVLKMIRNEIGVEFVKKSVYIKFGILRKYKYLHSLMPNVTIFAVNNPSTNIEKDSLKRVL